MNLPPDIQKKVEAEAENRIPIVNSLSESKRVLFCEGAEFAYSLLAKMNDKEIIRECICESVSYANDVAKRTDEIRECPVHPPPERSPV